MAIVKRCGFFLHDVHTFESPLSMVIDVFALNFLCFNSLPKQFLIKQSLIALYTTPLLIICSKKMKRP